MLKIDDDDIVFEEITEKASADIMSEENFEILAALYQELGTLLEKCEQRRWRWESRCVNGR